MVKLKDLRQKVRKDNNLNDDEKEFLDWLIIAYQVQNYARKVQKGGTENGN